MRNSRISQRLDIGHFLRYLAPLPDVSPNRPPDPEQIRPRNILRFISITAIMCLIPLGLLALVEKNIPVGIADLFLAVILIANILHGRRYRQYTFNIYLGVSLAAMLFVYMFLTGAMSRSGFVWYYTFPIIACFLLGSKKGAIATFLIFLPVVVLFLVKTPPSIFADYGLDFKLRFISSFSVVFAFSYLFEYSREKNREELQRTHDDLQMRFDERTSALHALEEAIQSLQKEMSERRRAEEALRQSEEKYRTIFENIEDGYYEVDLAGKFTFFNDSMCRIYGYPREEFMGISYRQYTDQETAKEVFQAYNRVYRTGEPGRGFDHDIIRKDGTKGHIEASISLLKDSSSKPIGFRGIIRDVTERKRTEEALRESENKFRDLAEKSLVGVYLIQDGVFKYVNARLAEINGYAAEELIDKKGPKDFIFPEDWPTVEENIGKRLSGEIESLHSEFRAITKDNRIINVEVYGSRTMYRGRPAVVGTLLDITDRKLAEEKLRESEEKYRTILENIEDGYYEADLAGNFTFFNDSMCRISRTPREELMGMNNRQYTDKENARKVFQIFNKVYRTGEPDRELDWEIIRKDGTKGYVEASVSLQKDSSGKPIGFRGIARDVTERKRAEEALREKTEELARSNKDLEQFAYVASHDLQEPLRMVTSYIRLLARRYKGKLDSDADEFISFAVDGAIRMWKLINDLLTYSRVGMPGQELEPTDCETVLNQSLNNLKVAIEENGAVVTHDPLPTVMGDNPQLVQLFQNLIGNAIKFRGNEPPHVHVSASRNGNGWIFSVRDNGIGIAPEYTERIFNLFQRLHSREEYPGTGIGLAVCQKIVEEHRGRIWVESEVGKGATFYFILPASRAEPLSS